MNKMSRLRAMIVAAAFAKKGYTDFRVCKKCRQARTGYEFVATVSGLSPDDCPDCGGANTSKRPWPLPQAPRVVATGEPLMRKATDAETLEFLRSQGF